MREAEAVIVAGDIITAAEGGESAGAGFERPALPIRLTLRRSGHRGFVAAAVPGAAAVPAAGAGRDAWAGPALAAVGVAPVTALSLAGRLVLPLPDRPFLLLIVACLGPLSALA